MTEKSTEPHVRISPWAALAWGAAIDVVLCVLCLNGGPTAPLLRVPELFIAILVLMPFVILYLITICNSPRYKHLGKD